MESRVQPKLLVRFGGLATRNPPTEEQEGRPGPTLHLISLPDVGRLVGRRERGVRIGSGFGRRSLVVFRVRIRLPGLGGRRRLGRDGSASLVG